MKRIEMFLGGDLPRYPEDLVEIRKQFPETCALTDVQLDKAWAAFSEDRYANWLSYSEETAAEFKEWMMENMR